ncbi:hypothetical protein BO443_100002 [Burkholderia orbicola]
MVLIVAASCELKLISNTFDILYFWRGFIKFAMNVGRATAT